MDTKSIIMNTIFIMCVLLGSSDIIFAYDDSSDYSGGPSTVITIGIAVAIICYWLLSAI